MLFLDKDSEKMVILGREGHLLIVHNSDEVAGGGLVEFYGLDQVGETPITRNIHLRRVRLLAALLLI
jgi:hypothetical protein